MENPIKHSGEMRSFDSGAIREEGKGKGRCDLLPMVALLRVSKHFENGAEHYGDRNWEKGIPLSVYMDSALRHMFKYMDGWNDEDHLVAACWNILCAMWTEDKRPDLQNIPARMVSICNSQDTCKTCPVRKVCDKNEEVKDDTNDRTI